VWAWARADFDKKAAEMARQGYRPRDLNGFIAADGGAAYNAVWDKAPGEREAVWGWKRADFDKHQALLAKRGFRLRTINAVLLNGVESFNAIWDKRPEERPAVWGWARADLDKKAAEMAAKGYRLAALNAYTLGNGEAAFNAIWSKTTEERPAVWGWTRADFDKKAAEMAAAGYRFIDLNSYGAMTGKLYYNAIWGKGAAEQAVVWDWARADFDKKYAQLAESGFRPSALNGSMPPRPCAISGRLVGGETYWPLTTVGVRGPGDYARRPAEPVRVDAQGAYAFAGLARGTYKVYTDMRADVGTGFKPAQHIVPCQSEKQSGIDFIWPGAAQNTGATPPAKGLGKE
jgi:hypothetical protein